MRTTATAKFFRPGVAMTVFVIVFLPLTIGLGFWQLSRASWKAQLLQHYQTLLNRSPISLSRHCCEPFTQVEVSGQPLAEDLYFVDNRTFQGQAGYEVVLPVKMNFGDFNYAWVSLGWIAGSADRSRLPEVEHLPNTLNWQGTVRQVAWQLTDSNTRLTSSYHLQLPGIDTQTIFPQLIQLNEDQPYSLTHIWQPSYISPARHLGYAVQWFLLALALVIMYLKLGFKHHPVEATREY